MLQFFKNNFTFLIECNYVIFSFCFLPPILTMSSPFKPFHSPSNSLSNSRLINLFKILFYIMYFDHVFPSPNLRSMGFYYITRESGTLIKPGEL